MNDLIRNPQIIAAEINGIKEQTRVVVLQASVEIGKRLTEAKALVKHGEWAAWLEENVDYSQRTASDLMAIAEGYKNANWQTFANLSQSQALELLGLPMAAREEFVATHDMEDTSVRDLREEVRKLKEQLEGKQTNLIDLQAAAEEAERKAEQEKRAADQLRDQLKDRQDALEKMRKEAAEKKDVEALARLEKELAAEREKADKLKKAADKLKTQLKEEQDKPPQIMQVLPPEAEEELERLRKQCKNLPSEEAARFRVQFETLTHDFGALLSTVGQMEGEEKARYIGAVKKLLVQMEAKL